MPAGLRGRAASRRDPCACRADGATTDAASTSATRRRPRSTRAAAPARVDGVRERPPGVAEREARPRREVAVGHRPPRGDESRRQLGERLLARLGAATAGTRSSKAAYVRCLPGVRAADRDPFELGEHEHVDEAEPGRRDTRAARAPRRARRACGVRPRATRRPRRARARRRRRRRPCGGSTCRSRGAPARPRAPSASGRPRVDEVPRGSQHVRAQDLAAVDRGGDGVRHPVGARRAPARRDPTARAGTPATAPRRSRRTTSARRHRARLAQPLHAQARCARSSASVHRYDTSRRQVVAPPMTVATTAMPSSTSPPCHHSRVCGAPDRGDVVERRADERVARGARQELADVRRDVVERRREPQDRLDELGEGDDDDDRRDLVRHERAESDADRAPERHREDAAADERPRVARRRAPVSRPNSASAAGARRRPTSAKAMTPRPAPTTSCDTNFAASTTDAVRLGEERGRERLVPELAGDRERAEQHGEHVADRRREAVEQRREVVRRAAACVLPPAAAAASGFSIAQPKNAPSPPAMNAT